MMTAAKPVIVVAVVAALIAAAIAFFMPSASENALAERLDDRMLLLTSEYAGNITDPLVFTEQELDPYPCAAHFILEEQVECDVRPGYGRSFAAQTDSSSITLFGLAFEENETARAYYDEVLAEAESLVDVSGSEVRPHIYDLTSGFVGADIQEAFYLYTPMNTQDNESTYRHVGIALLGNHVVVLNEQRENLVVFRSFEHAFTESSWNRTISYYNLSWTR